MNQNIKNRRSVVYFSMEVGIDEKFARIAVVWGSLPGTRSAPLQISGCRWFQSRFSTARAIFDKGWRPTGGRGKSRPPGTLRNCPKRSVSPSPGPNRRADRSPSGLALRCPGRERLQGPHLFSGRGPSRELGVGQGAGPVFVRRG